MDMIYQYTDPIRDAIYLIFKWAIIIGVLLGTCVWHLRKATSGFKSKFNFPPPTNNRYDSANAVSQNPPRDPNKDSGLARQDAEVIRASVVWMPLQEALDKIPTMRQGAALSYYLQNFAGK